ncbi:hypothetical protein [uncultured Roseobacter sp.]|nr:hypothetical protein [uncultured Roseobacter sp.]
MPGKVLDAAHWVGAIKRDVEGSQKNSYLSLMTGENGAIMV